MRKIVLSLFILGLVVRSWYFLYPLGRSAFLTVDEAVYGIQSLQILRGLRPVFYPAQVYTGSFSAYLTALLFFFGGFHPVLLKIVPYLFSNVFILLNYFLAKAVFQKRITAVMALTISALGTPFWNNWSSRAGTGYVETSAFGSLMMIMALRLVAGHDSKRKKVLLFFLLGFLSGLGFWIQPTIVYYLAPILLYLLVSYRGLFRQWASLFLPLGFLIGDLPVVIYNFSRDFPTTQTLFRLPWGVKSAFLKFVFEGLPVILGVRTSNSRLDFFTPLALFVETLALSAIAYFSYKVLRNLWHSFKSKSFSVTPPVLVFLVFYSTVIFFLLSTPFNQFSIEPRYTFALYSTLPLILAFMLSKLWERKRLFFVIFSAFYLVNWGLGLFLANPLTFGDRYRVESLGTYLKNNSLPYLIADPALGHRVMFYSKLGVSAEVRGGGITQGRFPEFNQKVINIRDADNFAVGFITVKGSNFEKDFEREIRSFVGELFVRDVVDEDFVVFRPLRH